MIDWQSSLFTGIFTRFSAMASRPHDPACSLSAGFTVPWQGHGEGTSASGIGWDEAMAHGACVGEAIERMQGGPVPDDRLVRASHAAWPLDEAAVEPARWVLFHPEQYAVRDFGFQPLTRDTVCEWVCCRHAATGEPTWVPAEMVYLHVPGGHRIAPSYSTGLAAGRLGDPVLLRGLQEVIERDAVMGAWWGRYPLEECAQSDVLAMLGDEIAARTQRANLRYRWLRIVTPFSAHVTMVTVEGEDREGYCFSIGSSCRETRDAGWRKSLLEAIHGRHYVRYLKNQVAADALKVNHCPTSFAEHAVYYSLFPERLNATVLRNIWKINSRIAEERGRGPVLRPPANDRISPGSPGARSTVTPATTNGSREVIDRAFLRKTIAPAGPIESASESTTDLIARLGPDRPVLFRSMTPPALASEQLGWQVLRVIVPGLQPLHGHHAYPHLGGPHWQPRGLQDWHAMPPHPFP